MSGWLEQHDLWVGGAGGYHTYRIPALAVTNRGTVLAFCEGRKHSRADAGEIDLLLRRSADGGLTWDATQVIVADPGMTCGNPAPIVDGATGTIWLPFCKNPADGDETAVRRGLATRTVWITHSTDDGATWSEAAEITSSVKRPSWTWYATGPCHALQLSSGRLLIPCDHRARSGAPDGDTAGTGERPVETRHSHVIYSDDRGATWQIGGVVPLEGTNESVAVETTGGAVYLNCRDQGKRGRRAAAWSDDGGLSFPPGGSAWDETLVEPACQASAVRFTTAATHDRDRVLFCNPAGASRDTLTVRLSYDECRSWNSGKVLNAGPAAYSDLAVAPDLAILCLFERGASGPYETLALARFDLDWLTDGADALGSSTLRDGKDPRHV